MHAKYYLLLLMPWVAIANPSDPIVIEGKAHFEGANSSTLLIQTSDGSIIHWGSFSIDQGEMTRFILPSGESAVLNRVVGNLPSSIAGHLESNGRVYLINPKGILVDKSGVINTNSFFASTLDVLDSEFLNGKEMLWKGDSEAAIVNLGRIQAREGDLFLFSRQIENRGVLKANQGVVGLGAGSDILLALEGEKRILIRPNLGGQVIDSGMIEAVQAEIEADGSGFGLGIRHSGKIQALGTEERAGRIYLVAEKGAVTTTGGLKAKDEVYVLGDKVGLYEEAKIEVPGGKVFVGGDFQGKNPEIPNATVTAVDRNVSIDVSGTNGGRVIVWADGECHFLGQIHAEGASGGFVEVSGKKFLNYDGTAHLKGQSGKNGSLLLDPVNLTIGGGADTAVVLFPTVGSIQYWQQSLDAAAMAVSNLTVASITTQLALGDLVVQAATDTLLSSATTLGFGLGDLIILDGTNLAAATENHLTLTADNNIYLHGQINYSADVGTGNTGNVNLIAGGDVLLVPYSENPAPTLPSLISLIPSATGQGNIYLQGKNIRIQTHSTNTTAGINNLGGTTTLNATQGSVTIEGGSIIGAQASIVSGSNVNITAVNGSLDLIGSPTATTDSAALINVTGQLTVNADLGVNLIGGGGNNNSAEISTGGRILINSSRGDIRILGGSAVNVSQITAGGEDLIINANQGNVYVIGGSGAGGNASLYSTSGSVYINAFGTDGIHLIGGTAGGANALIQTFGTGLISLNAWNGSLNLTASQTVGAASTTAIISSNTSLAFHTGFDCNIRGGAEFGSLGQMVALTGINGSIGGNLTLQGGTANATSATINNFSGDLNISVENHLSLLAGTGSLSFAQIGGNTNQTTSNIILSKIGGDCILRGVQTPAGMNFTSYAAIGHGDFSTAISSLQGDIVFTTGIGGNLILESGNTASTNNRTFAQIGHFSGTSNMGGFTVGDIRINEVGNSITLIPGTDYAMIGHGNNTTNTASNISGHIIVYSSTANCNFETLLFGAATSDVFCQIGHIGAQSTYGDILVDIGGPLKMRSTHTTNSLTLIGHGNTTSPATVSFTGNIEVYAQSIELIAGNATGAQSQIGMFAPLTSSVNIPILTIPGLPTRTNLIVEAVEDIYLQAGSNGMMLANAVIGFGPVSNGLANVTIDNLTVRSLQGDITLTGGNGTTSPITGSAFIGLRADGMVTPTHFQSDLTVECPQGTLTLNGVPPVTSLSSLNGSAVIVNGSSFSGNASPYNVFVNAGEIILNSAGVFTSSNSGIAQIISTRNMTIQTTHDLQLINPNGQVGITANGLNSDMTFRIGNDLILEGGNSSQISSNLNLSVGQAVTMTFGIGNDLILRPNSGGVSNAFIGLDPLVGMNSSQQTLAMDLKIGHDLIVLGGTASNGNMTAGIAAFPMQQSEQILTLRFDIGGNAQINGGTINNNMVRIGPTAMSAASQMVDLGMKVGGDLLLQAGNVSMTSGNSAFIAAPTMTASQQTLFVNFDVGGNLSLLANSSSGAVCLIGPASMTTGLQVFSLFTQVGGNLRLLGSLGANDLLIGPTSISGGNQRSTMDFVVGGDMEIQSGAGSSVIGTALSGGGISSSSTEFLIHFDVGGNTSLTALGSPAFIGPQSNSGINGIFGITLQGGGNLALYGGSNMSAFAGIGTDPTGGGFSGTGGVYTIDCSVEKDLIIQAGFGTGGHAFIGPSDVGNSRNTSTTRVSAKGNGVILGSNMGGSTQAIVGPGTFSGTDSSVTVSVDIGNDLLLKLGSTSASNALIGAPLMTGTRDTLTVNVDVGQTLTLDGGSGSSAFCQIGPLSNTMTDQRVFVNVNTGKDLILQGNTGSSTATAIGLTNLSGSTNQTARFALDVGGNLYLSGSNSATSFTYIGFNSYNGTSNNAFTIDLNVGDSAFLRGGNGSFAYIGTSTFSSANSTATFAINIGNDLFMGSDGTNCFIGSDSLMAANQILDISLDVGRNCLLKGSTGSSVDVHIGPRSVLGSTNSSLLQMDVGGNLTLSGSTSNMNTSNNVYIGPFTALAGSTNMINTMDLHVGGDCLMMAGDTTNNSVYIAATNMQADNHLLSLNMDVGGSLIMDGGSTATGFCQIGPQSGIGQFQNYNLNFTIGKDLNLYASSDTSSITLIGASTFTSTNGHGSLTFDIGRNLLLQGDSVGGSACQIGVTNASTETSLLFNRIGGNASVISGVNYALIGHGPSATTTPTGDIYFKEVVGNFLVNGRGSFAQVGHVGQSGGASTLTGDITFEEIGGTLTLQGGGAINGTATIGHGNLFGNADDTLIGSISIRAGAAELLASGSSAIIGFDAPTGGTITITSPLVELIADRNVTLTAGNASKSVIGYYNPLATTTATIDVINVNANRGNITLTGSTSGINGGGFAVIGTRSMMGTARSTIKITAGRDLILNSGGLGGGALIVNNRVGVFQPGYTINIDPISIILLSGASGSAAIFSGGNLFLNFDDRLDINFDSINAVLQDGVANVLAGSDIYINTSTPSYGSINIGGSTLIGNTTSIQSGAGSIFVGTETSPGAGDINVGFVAATLGPTTIQSLVETQIHAAGNINVQGGGASSIISNGNVTLDSGNNILLSSAGGSQASSISGSLFLTAAGSITGAGGTFNASGSVISNAGLDLTVTNGAMTTNTGDVVATVGRDITITAGTGTTSIGGNYIAVAGRDINQAGPASFPGGGVIDLTAGRSVNSTSTVGNNTGTISFTAGEDVNITAGTVTSLAGRIELEADRNVTNTVATTISAGSGMLTVTAGQNISQTAGSLSNVSGILSMAAGEDISLTGGTVTSTSGSIRLEAERNVTNSIGTTVSAGSGMLTVIAGQNINQTAGTLSNVGGILSLSAGEDINLVGGSVTSSSGSIQLNAARNVVNSITTSVSSGGGGLFATAGQYINQSGTFSNISGTLSLSAGIDYNLTGSTTSSSGDIQIRVDRDINLSGTGIISTNGTEPIDARAKNNVNLSNTSSIRQLNIGEILVVADRNMNLNGSSLIFTSTGFLVLVVDNLFPEPPNYGRGSLFINAAGGAQVNASGGELRIYTSRQSFNTMTGALLNSTAFAPGTVYVDTATEMWDSYWAKALGGTPYTVFYKDAPTTVPPIPPVPPTPPAPVVIVTPTGVVTVTFDTFNKFYAAIAEPYRDWATFDEFIFDADEYDQEIKCPKFPSGSLALSEREITSGTSASTCSSGKQTLTMLRQKYRNYHTKKLDLP